MTTYDEQSGLPTETHRAPDDIAKVADADGYTVPLGTGIEVDGHVFTEAKIKIVGGMSESAIPDPPRRGRCRTYVVKAQCVRYIIDEKAEEPRLILEMEHYVVYDRDQGPLNDRQRVDTPEQLEELDRKAKEVADDPDEDVDAEGGLFDGAGNITGDLEADGPEFSDGEQ